jgi:proline iminopeptidase
MLTLQTGSSAPTWPHVTTGAAYSPITPYSTFYLPVGGKHVLYVEQSGNPHGLPVVILHGGPGSAPPDAFRCFHNPDIYRIVMFHQRGCGLSTPSAEIEDNTTWHLVRDIETIRKELGIDTWHVFGGSWGSTLALAYAITYPARVRTLVLRGVFFGQREELDWFYEKTGARFIFPEAYAKLAAVIPPAEQGNIVLAYHKRLTGTDEQERIKAALAWSVWETSCVHLWQDEAAIQDAEKDVKGALQVASIENWYFVNGCFFPGNKPYSRRAKAQPHWILRNLDRIRHIPAIMCDGRYDCDCPIVRAWQLSEAWPEAQFWKITDSGHSAMEPPLRRALTQATDWFGLADLGNLLDGRWTKAVKRIS